MHEATVTASATRKDGKGFKATLPEYGEVWLNLAASDVGKVEWKKTYDIGFTVKPNPKGGNYFDVKRIGSPALPQEAFKPAGAAQAKSSYGGADPRQIFVCAIVKEWVPSIPVGNAAELAAAIQAAMEAYDLTFGGKAKAALADDPNDDLEF